MVELLIIADDLTGAIETGVQLAKQGISARVIHNPGTDLHQSLQKIDSTVVVYNTESRHIEQRLAARRVGQVVKISRERGIKHFYKKTDSTMRGNIGAELQAFQEETGQNSIPFIPAHPKLKRFTKEGYHYIGEQLLHQTEFGNDPLEPIEISFLPDLLQKQTNLKISLIYKAGYDSLPKINGILVFDCQSVKDLEKIATDLIKNNLHKSIAGSAAMCELTPVLFNLKSKRLKLPELNKPTLLVNGSLNKISLNQVKFAHEKGIKIITLPEHLLSSKNYKKDPDFRQILTDIHEEIQAGRNVILSSSDIRAEPNNKNNDKVEYEVVSKQIGSIIAEIFNELHISSLFVIGGDTLMGIMDRMNCDAIAPLTEILPGVGLSMASVKNQSIQILTKPGGYGNKDVIVQTFNVIKESNQ
ncbi:four-carbon acid sugar kinase family protein [Rhodohalobacter sulfatireducens]|uniref:Four-carbon acid sugar kinase family protein n=1 Tax=Rhodohalobacter sulfatireducens TaxID=2911366 RepID=A0ABS9K9M4_9BACT|nr:four-carbon acid sugar kinase family protein [Rhodohalobacter sulfatireducens]MCG2587512.1 four-carbon acid sugar kinase family protein [Rhodohalobacter sulfatireducens]